MNERIICKETKIRSCFLALEMEKDCSEYCVSVDGEVIVWNKKMSDADLNYSRVKANLLNGIYVRERVQCDS